MSRYFAAVGDVHGHFGTMVRLLQTVERKLGINLGFVLQVGDLEPVRDETDLETVACPEKYRHIGDFPQVVAGVIPIPWPTYFIGGNHEPHRFLEAMPDGGMVAPNCHYLGRVFAGPLEGLEVAGLSGIFSAKWHDHARPVFGEDAKIALKRWTYFCQDDVDQLVRLAKGREIDVLLLHDWPRGMVTSSNLDSLRRRNPRITIETAGNETGAVLVEALRPKLVLCGHMHLPLAAELACRNAQRVPVRCLASTAEEFESIAIFEVDEQGAIREIPI